MANPEWQFQDGFESGDDTAWDITEIDTGSFLDFPHYRELARIPGIGMPYSGAYCMRINYTDTPAVAYVGDDAIDIGDGETIWTRCNIFVDPAISTATNDDVIFLDFRQTSNATIFKAAIWVDTANGVVKWRVGDFASAATSTATLELGCWYTVELKINVQTGAATGDITLYATKEGDLPSTTAAVALTGKQAAAPVLNALFGLNGATASTRGYILLDNLVTTADGGSRIWPDTDRFSTTKEITRSEHVFLGAGTVSGVQLTGDSNADQVLTIYDTDIGKNWTSNKKVALVTSGEVLTVSSEISFDVIRGCYAVLEGTNPEAIIHIARAPNWFSEGNIRRFALR